MVSSDIAKARSNDKINLTGVHVRMSYIIKILQVLSQLGILSIFNMSELLKRWFVNYFFHQIFLYDSGRNIFIRFTFTHQQMWPLCKISSSVLKFMFLLSHLKLICTAPHCTEELKSSMTQDFFQDLRGSKWDSITGGQSCIIFLKAKHMIS